MNTTHLSLRRRDQGGAALIITLVLLVIITLLGLASLRQTAMEERMSANMKDRSIALQSAEVGLRGGEQWLTSQPEVVTAALKFGADDMVNWKSSDWTDKGTAVTAAGVSPAPTYATELWMSDSPSVEEADKGMGKHYYRITARGLGGSGQIDVVLQEIKPIVFK